MGNRKGREIKGKTRAGDYGQAGVDSPVNPSTRGAIAAVSITGLCGMTEVSTTALPSDEGFSKGLARKLPGVGERLSDFESTKVLNCPPWPLAQRTP